MEKVAVLPVPDRARTITSCPFTTGKIARCWIADGRLKLGGRDESPIRSNVEDTFEIAHP